MPTYEYECRRCGHAFEAFQSMTDKPLRTCPECGGRVRRLIGAGAGIIFKGSGFYATDYRSTNYTNGAKADKPKVGSKAESKSGPSCPAEAGKGGGCGGGSCAAS
jgi:putative FmdB family regulatory protein